MILPSRARTSSSKSKPKTKTRTSVKRTSKVRNATGTKHTKTTRTAPKSLNETTYLYECTQADCNYRIVRDEKGEHGERRYDLKCPKCHHQEFRCLGPGDLTPEQPLRVPMVEIDFGAFKTIGLGAN